MLFPFLVMEILYTIVAQRSLVVPKDLLSCRMFQTFTLDKLPILLFVRLQVTTEAICD